MLPHSRSVTVAGVLTGALAGALALAGCRAAVDRAFQKPTFTFTGATLRGIGLQGGTIDVLATVHNPNPYPLHAVRARYRLLTADSAEVGAGEAHDSLTVAAHDSAVLLLPLRVDLGGLVRAGVGVMAGAAATGAAEYRVLGDVVLVSTPAGELTLPIDARGKAVLSRR